MADASSSGTSSSGPSARPDSLRFAVTDVNGLEELERDFGVFQATLESILGMPITFYPVPNYSAAAPALLANELDMALAGPSEYLLLRGRAQAEPLVKVTRPSYYSVIMTRQDSNLESLTDLKGKTIAMRTEGSTAGHIFPMKLLMDAGVQPEDFQIKMLAQKSLPALISGEVDAWADSYSRYTQFISDQGMEQEVKILAQGEPLPGDIFVANPSLDPAFIQELQSTMLAHQEILLKALASSEANTKYTESRMSMAQDSDYDEMRRVYQTIGLESAIQ